MWFKPFWPVEDVRGGMALGDRKFSDTIVEGPACETFRWNIRKSDGAPGCTLRLLIWEGARQDRSWQNGWVRNTQAAGFCFM